MVSAICIIQLTNCTNVLSVHRDRRLSALRSARRLPVEQLPLPVRPVQHGAARGARAAAGRGLPELSAGEVRATGAAAQHLSSGDAAVQRRSAGDVCADIGLQSD